MGKGKSVVETEREIGQKKEEKREEREEKGRGKTAKERSSIL